MIKNKLSAHIWLQMWLENYVRWKNYIIWVLCKLLTTYEKFKIFSNDKSLWEPN